MKKPLLIVATMVALAGCHSQTSSQTSNQGSGSQPGSSSQQARQSTTPSGQGPASESATASAANAPRPNMPIGSADGQTNGQASQDTFNHDSSSLGDAGAGWSSQSTAGSQSGDLGSTSGSTPAPDVEVGDAAGDSKGSSVQTPDKKNDGQRGSVLTNDGAITPSARNGASATNGSNEAQSGTQSGSVKGSDDADSIRDTAITDATTLGETESDRKLSQQIRQAVVNDETLSLASKSVQIQSSNGQIILKGQVDSEREKARIGSTAFRASGGKLVLNQLEVSGR